MLNSLCITPNFYRHEGCAVIWFKTTLTTQRENTLRLMRWFTWSKLILIKWIRSSLMKSDNDNKTLIKTDRDNVWFVQTDKSWCLIRHQLCPPLIMIFWIGENRSEKKIRLIFFIIRRKKWKKESVDLFHKKQNCAVLCFCAKNTNRLKESSFLANFVFF